MKPIVGIALALVTILLSCSKNKSSRITQVDVRLLDRTGMSVSGDTVWEFYTFKTVPDPPTGFPPYPLYYSNSRISNAAGIASFIIHDSVFRYQDEVDATYNYRSWINGTEQWKSFRSKISRGNFIEASIQTD